MKLLYLSILLFFPFPRLIYIHLYVIQKKKSNNYVRIGLIHQFAFVRSFCLCLLSDFLWSLLVFLWGPFLLLFFHRWLIQSFLSFSLSLLSTLSIISAEEPRWIEPEWFQDEQ